MASNKCNSSGSNRSSTVWTLNFPAPKGTMIHPRSENTKMHLQITPIASLLPKAMPTTHTPLISQQNLPKPQTQQPVSRIINPLINFRHFALSCRVPDTDLLIIYKAGSFAGGLTMI